MTDQPITTNGDSTLVDLVIDGRLRRVSVSRDWIDARFGMRPGSAAVPTSKQREDFVRAHLSEVVAAAQAKLGRTNPDADLVMVQTKD